MMKKERFLIFAIIFLILVNFVNFAFAQNYAGSYSILGQGSRDLINYIVSWAEPFLQALFGGDNYDGTMLFEKLLVFILILCIVYISLRRVNLFENQPFIIWVISIIIPLLSVRYINVMWMNTILIQYQVIGIAIAGILPVIVYFFFLQGIESSTMRKIGWIFFIMVYYGLYTTSNVPSFAQIYFWTMFVALALLLMDGTIQRAWLMQRFNEGKKLPIIEAVAAIEEKLRKIRQLSPDTPGRDRAIKQLERERDRLAKSYGHASTGRRSPGSAWGGGY
jgi:hypothetical protein